LLLQGEGDTLFNLNESVATYRALKKQGTPVKLVWQSWGHSHSTPAPGELGDGDGGFTPDDAAGNPTYEGELVVGWLAHYLKGEGPAPSMDFNYFRDWVRYDGIATPAYGSAPSYPAGSERKWLLSGTDTLATTKRDVSPGTASFVTPPLGAPTSLTEISALSQDVPLFDAPGTYAQYTSAPLTQDTDVVGTPKVTINVKTLLGLNPSPTLFLKVQDVAPDGTVTQPGRLVAPIRPASLTYPLTVTMPAFVHRFATGHRIRLVVAGSDAAYRGSPAPAAVTIATTQSDPGLLTLPVVSG
jgi:ABC-2 type transport system ATP-binding protein